MQLTVHETPSQAIERVKAKIHIRARYENFIGGQWVAAGEGPVFPEHHADQRPGRLRGRPLVRRGHRGRPRRRPQGQDRLGQDFAGQSRRRAAQDRRPHGSVHSRDRDHRDHRQRQADPRDDGRRHPARRRPLPLLRRLPARPGRLDLRDRRDHRRLPLPRAARRRRPDHPLELPAADGRAGSWRRRLPPATASC